MILFFPSLQALLSSALRCSLGMIQDQPPIVVQSSLGLSVQTAVLTPSAITSRASTIPVHVSCLVSPAIAGVGQEGVAVAVISVSPLLSSWVTGTAVLDNLKDYKTGIVAVGSLPPPLPPVPPPHSMAMQCTFVMFF